MSVPDSDCFVGVPNDKCAVSVTDSDCLESLPDSACFFSGSYTINVVSGLDSDFLYVCQGRAVL